MDTPKRPRIVVAEDDPEILSSLSGLLKKEGCEAAEAESGEQCLQLARAMTPEIILLDAALPDADGIKICRSIKSEPDLAGSLVALMSGPGTISEDRAAGLEAGADEYIVRPVSSRELAARVRALLRIKQAEDNVRQERDRLASILENSDDAIIGVRLDGRVFAWNTGAEQLFGRRKENAHGRPVSSLIPLENPEKLTDAVDKIKQDEQPVYLSSLPLKPGNEAEFISVTVSPVRELQARLTGISLVARDSTEQVQACELCRRELITMEGLSGPAHASVTAESFGLSPLYEARPALFSNLVKNYEKAIEHSWENKVYRVNHPVSDELRQIAEELGNAWAGPRDVVQVHITALKNKEKNVPLAKMQAYTEKGRVLIVELMGYLISHYRNSLLGTKKTGKAGSL